jgi:hypothetical protein
MTARPTPTQILMRSVRALLPTLIVDTGGATLVYFLLAPHYSANSIWPVLGASMVPAASNIVNFVRRRSFDIIGLIVLLGLILGSLPAIWGGSSRLLLVRESFLTGAVGVALIVTTFFLRKPVMYHVIHEVLTANETLPDAEFEVLLRSPVFLSGTRAWSFAWGALLVGEFCLRAFMALRMNVAFVIGVAPVLMTILLLCAGLATAIWLRWAIARALAGSQS